MYIEMDQLETTLRSDNKRGKVSKIANKILSQMGDISNMNRQVTFDNI